MAKTYKQVMDEARKAVPEVSPEQVKASLGAAKAPVLLDVREKEEIRQGYVGLGLGTRRWDTTLIASQFGYAPDTSFGAAAQQTYQLALARDGRAAAKLVKERFAARGITF